MNFGENFKRLRKEKDVTQEKIAEALGVSSQSVSRWELSICYPDLELLPSIANYFGVTIDSLLSNDAPSKKQDFDIFNETVNKLSCETTEQIDFIKEYCKKYPEVDYYAYHLVYAIKDHVIGDEQKAEKYMPLMLKNAQRLLETKHRTAIIQLMAMTCYEKELDNWLDKSTYTGFSRRDCLIHRAIARNDAVNDNIQSGLQMIENMAIQLDTRFPDKLGAKRKIEFQRSVLRVIESFGKEGEAPDGWKRYYAYKQLVLAACLFGNGEKEEGWKNFDSAIETLKYVTSLKDEWLDIGDVLFSNLKVSPDWNYAIDEKGNKHKLFGIVRRSFFNMLYIHDLLTNKRWAWFNSVRDTEKYKNAVKWVQVIKDEQSKNK